MSWRELNLKTPETKKEAALADDNDDDVDDDKR